MYVCMQFLPRTIIFFAVQNYLNNEQVECLIKDLVKGPNLTDKRFLKELAKHFDIKDFRDKPYIPEDIWLFNYLMYENHKCHDFNPLFYGEQIALKGRFLKKGSIIKYENQIILPQFALVKEAKKLLEFPEK